MRVRAQVQRLYGPLTEVHWASMACSIRICMYRNFLPLKTWLSMYGSTWRPCSSILRGTASLQCHISCVHEPNEEYIQPRLKTQSSLILMSSKGGGGGETIWYLCVDETAAPTGYTSLQQDISVSSANSFGHWQPHVGMGSSARSYRTIWSYPNCACSLFCKFGCLLPSVSGIVSSISSHGANLYPLVNQKVPSIQSQGYSLTKNIHVYRIQQGSHVADKMWRRTAPTRKWV